MHCRGISLAVVYHAALAAVVLATDIPHFLVRLLLSCMFRSLVYLIKRSRIIEATVPNLIHHPHSLHVILATWSIRNTDRCSSSYALLQLLRDTELSSCEELSTEPALSAQCTRADLHTCSMPEIKRIHLEPHIIVCMHHLVS